MVVSLSIGSRWVNGTLFLLFDVIGLYILASFLCTLQSYSVKRRLLGGQRVRVRESRLKIVTGGILSDGTIVAKALIVCHMALVALLFVLTLGVNGRTDAVKESTERLYVTRLAGRFDEYNRERLRPNVLAGCSTLDGSRITYFPFAFNTAGGIRLADKFAFRDEAGARVPIDAGSAICQDAGNLQALLEVPRCGADIDECQNLAITEGLSVLLNAEPSGQERFNTNFNVAVGSGAGTLEVLYRNVRVTGGTEAMQRYNRAICKERPVQGDESFPDTGGSNCLLGQWDETGQEFTFVIGQMEYPIDTRAAVIDDTVVPGEVVNFLITSAEVVVKWDGAQSGETFFADGLSALTQDFSAAGPYLEEAVRRAVVADEVGGRTVLMDQTIGVTDINVAALVGYATWFGIAIALLVTWIVLKCVRKNRRIGVDVTAYDGLSSMLREESDGGKKCGEQGSVAEIGITRVGGLYRLGAVKSTDEVVSLPNSAALGASDEDERAYWDMERGTGKAF